MQKNQVLKYLQNDFLTNCFMIEVIKNEPTTIHYFGSGGVLMSSCVSNIPLTNIEDEIELKTGLKSLKSANIFVATSENSAKIIAKTFNLTKIKECYQIVYEGKDLLPIDRNIEIKKLEYSHKTACFVKERYTLNYSLEEIEYLLKNVGLYGAYIDGELAGFIGRHKELSLGLLEVFPKFRRKGIGKNLVNFMLNDCLNSGKIAFGHVLSTNEASLNLMKKIGFTICAKKIYWIE